MTKRSLSHTVQKRRQDTPPIVRFLRSMRTPLVTGLCFALLVFLALPLLNERITGANQGEVPLELTPIATSPTPSGTTAPQRAITQNHSLPQTATPEPTMGLQVSQYTVLKENDAYPSVKELQLRLMELGYLDADEPTTTYTASTAAAVSLYQRTLDYDMNGIADSDLQEHLFSSDAEAYEIKQGDSGADVRSMQARLNELGYYQDKVSGFYGVATETSVRAFQKKNKIAESGEFHVEDRELLFSPEARPAVDPTPTPAPTPKPTKKPSGSSSKSQSGKSSSSSSSSGSSSSSSSSSSSGSVSSGSSYSASYSASGLISVAKAQQGKPYVWSEEGPDSFDCSGLVYFCLRTCGVKTSRYSANGFSGVGHWKNIHSAHDLQRGDLVFFKSDSSSSVNHTGIYLGSDRFIHASSSAGKVIVSNITTSYWTRNFVNGRRVF